MTGTGLLLAVSATLLGLAGLALLFKVWRKPGQPVLLASGWALLAVSLLLWFVANHDRGVAQVTSLLMLLVAGAITLPGFLGTNGLQSPVRERPAPALAPVSALGRAQRVASGIWTFLIAGPIAGLIAFFTAGGLLRLIRPETGNPATAVVSAFIAALVLWALLSTLLLMEKRPLRRSAYAIGGSFFALAVAFIG
ncbi:MAG: hypothetical protein GYB49_10850 [Alphaproteobacteria bacterium]|nr:hypothetical protein [Hyphomonas sp.]MBR9807708.1 hypothetical protein [Alphaproteobacteria bacterium]|tara:strand:+ start:5447 stop:6031 length:585 start_codon:yes stop_codon:yes gene_type:complete